MSICRHCFYQIGFRILMPLLFLLVAQPASAQDTTEPALVERVAVVRGQGALLLRDPDRAAKTLLPAGSLVMLTGRSEDDSLLFVESGAYGNGWVAAGSLLTVDTIELPIRSIATISNRGSNEGNMESTVVSAPAIAPTEVGAASEQTSPQIENAPINGTREGASASGGRGGDGAIYAQVTLTDSRLNLRAGPGTRYPVTAKAEPGSEWQVIGRDNSSDWLKLRSSTSGESLWATATYLAANVPLTAIPVVQEIPPAPQSTTLTATPSAVRNDTQSADPRISNPTSNPATNNQTGLSGTLVFNDRVGATIYAYRLETNAMWPLTGGIDPAISPNGEMVAFTRDGGGNGVYVINIDGSGERLLYGGHELLRSPKWSPDGQFLVFSRSNGFEDCRVLDGGVCLPDAALLDSLPPELQTGDAVNAVRGLPNQRAYNTVLSRIGIDGNAYRDIPSLNRAGAPDWSDAGIVYHAGGGAGIQRTADADVISTLVVNDELHGNFLDPDWQPNGGRIAFYRKLGGHWQIHLVNPDGSGLTAITRPVTALVDELPSNVAPAWSPDGQYIVYVSNRNSIESAGAWHFWVMNADGSDQHQLAIDLPLEYTFSAEQMISWGPSTG